MMYQAYREELEKISKKLSERESTARRNEARVAGGAASFVPGAIGKAMLPSYVRSSGVLDDLGKMESHGLNPDQIRKLKGAIGLSKGRKVEFRKLPEELRNAGGFMVPPAEEADMLTSHGYRAMGVEPKKGVTLIYAKSPGNLIAAHELGHAKVRNRAIGRLLSRTRTYGSLAAVPAAVAAGVVDPDSKASKAAVLAGAVGGTGLLADEGLASIHGHRGLKRVGASPQQMKAYRRAMAKAFGTYGIVGGAAIAAPLLAREVRKRVAK